MSDIAIQSEDPILQHEVAYISGLNSDGTVAGDTYWSEKNDPDKAKPHKLGDTTAGTPGGTISYTFDAPGETSDPPWSATEQAWFNAAFALWSSIANIKFVQASDPSTAKVEIVRGDDDSAVTYTSDQSVAVGSSVIPNPSGTILVSIDTDGNGFGPIENLQKHGGYPIETVVHELGHVLGLGHGGNYNAGNGRSPGDNQETPYDTRQYSIMSYLNPQDPTGRYNSQNPVAGTDWHNPDTGKEMNPTTFMPLDILAAQRLYGAPTDTPLSGGQCFGFNCTIQGAIRPFFDFTQNTDPVITIWDGGTGNTLDLSGFSLTSIISLKPGSFTSADGLTNNIAIAFDTSVTTAIGGAGNDFFYVDGAEGTQTLIGGDGVDYLGVDDAAGSGTILVNLAGDYVSRGDLLDANFQSIEAVTLGANDATVLGTSSGTDLIYGGSGTLNFYGSGGTDYIQGGTGTNNIVGGAGSEIFYSGNGTNTMLGGSGSNFMQGGDDASAYDAFYGNGGDDFVYGEGGHILLIGGSGTETLTGGSGINELIGANTADASGRTGFNIFIGGQGDQAGTDTFYAGVGTNLFYEGSGTSIFAGNAGTDYIYGGDGQSAVYGGTGTTVVTTGAGNQYLQAGTGNTFFNETGANLTAGRFDKIDNFQVAGDDTGGKGTFLYLPQAIQDTTSFQDVDGGTAITMPTVTGAGSAELFVSHVASASVMAQTHFA